MFSAQKLFIIILIFMVSIPLVFAADLPLQDDIGPTTIVIRQGSTAITDSLASKSDGQKSAILTTATATALKDTKYPYLVSGTELTISKSKCTGETCGYWVSCTRSGKEVKTNSPVWISPPPYEVVVSDVIDTKANTEAITLKENPKQAAEEALTGYCDRQPIGKAVSYER
jgi:hypothetical protein